MPTITSFYAGLIVLLYLVLCARVILYRRANLISLGDKGDKNLLKRMRVQSNCAEYAPLGLILLLLLEAGAAAPWLLNLLGLMLLSGRVLHAIGMGRTPQILLLRQIGMGLTLAMLAISASLAVAFAIF
ncbi:Inner membrane protein YecN [Pseudoruegeria aquimaris]|uniref:Inner membrane protein YecN n=1 Tax=Pseudoruegeria aquimaris TaxID=393663 RepID=A0A1Y5RF52_9RHOB|nr:MAPEG family protein [Pseudoruegeria aquimaris]SLN14783.1 Inner membrane protein YecN [Pseudoruegeria aquimaris]